MRVSPEKNTLKESICCFGKNETLHQTLQIVCNGQHVTAAELALGIQKEIWEGWLKNMGV
jgi:hypothetical protein